MILVWHYLYLRSVADKFVTVQTVSRPNRAHGERIAGSRREKQREKCETERDKTFVDRCGIQRVQKPSFQSQMQFRMKNGRHKLNGIVKVNPIKRC